MRKSITALLIVGVLALLAYLLKDVDFVEVYSLLRELNFFYLVLAVFTGFAGFAIWTLRFKYSLRGLCRPSFWFLFKVLLAGCFICTLTPGARVGGEPVRAYFLGKRYNKPKSKVLGVVLADKLINFLTFLFFLFFSILFVLVFIEVSFSYKLIFEIILLSVFFLAVWILVLIFKRKRLDLEGFFKKFYFLKFIRKKYGGKKHFELYIDEVIKNFRGVFRRTINNKKKFYYGVLLSVGFWLLHALVSYFLFLGLGERVNFLLVLIVVTISYMVGDISPVPGGIGFMEGSMFLLYSAMGITPALAIIVTLLSRVIYYFYTLFLGGLSFVYLNWRLNHEI